MGFARIGKGDCFPRVTENESEMKRNRMRGCEIQDEWVEFGRRWANELNLSFHLVFRPKYKDNAPSPNAFRFVCWVIIGFRRMVVLDLP